MSRKVFWILFVASLALTLGMKTVQLGWFNPRPPLELGREPALLFFNKARGCECELFVYNNANAQIDAWDKPMRVIRIDMDYRPDLAREYKVIRAPSLVLVNAEGQVAWKQNESLNDGSPLDLEQVEMLVEKDLP